MISIRKIGVLGRTYRHLNRYRQILTILFKYGFGDIVDRLKIDQYLEVGLQMISRNRRDNGTRHSRAVRLRLMLEDLGPTFVKLGQILSTRPDMIPPDVLAELKKLQDEVPPFSFEEARQIVEKELGGDLNDYFSFFESLPLASASIGQVYRGELHEGEAVAVKVRRPGIRKIIEVDLEIMLHLATLMEKNIEEISLHRPIRVVEEFARVLSRELDYRIEASNLERVAGDFLRDSHVYIPKVFKDYSTSSVLTMEYIDGIKVSDVEALDKAGLDKVKINARGADFVLKQVFDHGFFHADLHPGNIFVLSGNVICPVDFGMVGTINRRERDLFVDLLEAVARKNASKASRVLMLIGESDDSLGPEAFEKEVEAFMAIHLFKPLKEIDLGAMIHDFFTTAARYQFRIPPDIFLMIKSFAFLEGIGRILDPEFDMVAYAAPFVKRAKLSRFSPWRVADEIFATASDSIDFVRKFPLEILELMKVLRLGRLNVRFELNEFDRMLKTHDQISNRISFSIVIGALIMGSAMILASETPPLVYGLSLIGIIGFSGAAIMGIWLLVAILRKGRL